MSKVKFKFFVRGHVFDTWYPHGIKSVERRGIFILNDLLIRFLKQAVMIVDVQKPVAHPS